MSGRPLWVVNECEVFVRWMDGICERVAGVVSEVRTGQSGCSIDMGSPLGRERTVTINLSGYHCDIVQVAGAISGTSTDLSPGPCVRSSITALPSDISERKGLDTLPRVCFLARRHVIKPMRSRTQATGFLIQSGPWALCRTLIYPTRWIGMPKS